MLLSNHYVRMFTLPTYDIMSLCRFVSAEWTRLENAKTVYGRRHTNISIMFSGFIAFFLIWLYPTSHEPRHTLPFCTGQSPRSWCWPKEKRALGRDWNFLVPDFAWFRPERLTKNVPAQDTRLAINSFTNLESATEIQVFSLNLYEPN